MKIFILGSSTTKFGELWGESLGSLGKEAFEYALLDSGLERKNIDALFVGNMLSGVLGGQEHLGAFFTEELGLKVPAFKIEGACASGGLVLHNAINSILSNQYKTVAVLGVEKMTDYKSEVVASALMGAGSEEERLSGITFPGLYALMARSYMSRFGTTEKQLATVSVKNHYHASLNPNAQFNNLLTVGEVVKSPYVADPLKLLECSPISDGASVVIISNKRFSKKKVQIVASSVAVDTLGLSKRENFTELATTQKASKVAYKIANINPKDVDIAEVHDCFSIAEIFAIEDLGFYKKGFAAVAVAKGETTLGISKHLVVNTSGGLKGCGHPVGATGIKQIVEIAHQLEGHAGKRQVKDARIGLAQNVGGSGGTAVVHILKNYD